MSQFESSGVPPFAPLFFHESRDTMRRYALLTAIEVLQRAADHSRIVAFLILLCGLCLSTSQGAPAPVVPPPPANTKIPVWNVEAKVVYSKAFPGFMDIEIYQENGRFFVRDKIKRSEYKGSRPRRFYYVDLVNATALRQRVTFLQRRPDIFHVHVVEIGRAHV